VDPLLYRLWGLQPLQSQLIKPGEMVLEVWARPATGVRQAVVRVTVRRDGRAFVQARAGLGCCTPEIGRRVDIDAELAAQQIPPLKTLVGAPMWGQPRSVIVDYGGGAVEPVCLEGVSWDVTLLVPGQARHLRRACDDAEVGSIAPALAAALSAASGRDARFDVMFARGGDFSRQQQAYDSLIASGGRLKAGTNSRPQPPGVPRRRRTSQWKAPRPHLRTSESLIRVGARIDCGLEITPLSNLAIVWRRRHDQERFAEIRAGCRRRRRRAWRGRRRPGPGLAEDASSEVRPDRRGSVGPRNCRPGACINAPVDGAPASNTCPSSIRAHQDLDLQLRRQSQPHSPWSPSTATGKIVRNVEAGGGRYIFDVFSDDHRPEDDHQSASSPRRRS
jgi:hypothetical protein